MSISVCHQYTHTSEENNVAYNYWGESVRKSVSVQYSQNHSSTSLAFSNVAVTKYRNWKTVVLYIDTSKNATSILTLAWQE